MRKYLFALSFLALFSCHCALAEEEKYKEPTAVLSGKVTNHQNLPVVHALVIVTDRANRERLVATTDRRGEFKITHKPTADETVQVIPPERSELSQIIINQVPGEEDRHLILSARPGFRVTGRIMAAGKPLKGAQVKAVSHDPDVVHSGGEAITDGKGYYAMILTPGEKTLEIISRAPQEFSGLMRHKISVTSDKQFSDLTLTPTQTAEVLK